MRLAVFDLDGTLADTSRDLIAAANATLAEAGRTATLDPDRDRALAFAGGRAMLRAGLAACGGDSETEVDRLYPRLLAHYTVGIVGATRLYDGVEAALGQLQGQGWGLAVCTNKPAGLADLLLRRLDLRHLFAAMLGADSLDVRKPDPGHLLGTIAAAGGSPAAAVLIGDTITDRDAARAAGVRCVLVGFGPEGAAVADLAPDAVLRHYDDLPDLLARILPADALPA